MKRKKILFFIITALVGIVIGLTLAYYNVRISDHAQFMILLKTDTAVMVFYTVLTTLSVMAMAYFIVDMIKIDRSVLSYTVHKLWHADNAHYVTINMIYSLSGLSTDDNTQTILIDPDTYGQLSENEKVQVEKTINLIGDVRYELSKVRA